MKERSAEELLGNARRLAKDAIGAGGTEEMRAWRCLLREMGAAISAGDGVGERAEALSKVEHAARLWKQASIDCAARIRIVQELGLL